MGSDELGTGHRRRACPANRQPDSVARALAALLASEAPLRAPVSAIRIFHATIRNLNRQ